MFSVESPPEPSSSRKVLALESDDRVHSLERSSSLETPNLGFDLDDDEEQRPNFCLRNYVFASRSKDLSVNWPFPQQFLQLCLKHGVRDPLPPFEPPDSMRTQRVADAGEAHHRLVSSPAVEGAPAEANAAAIASTSPSDSEPDPPAADPCLDPAPDPPRESSSEEKSAGSSAAKSVAPPPAVDDRTRSETSASGQAEKKTRLVVKSGASESSRSGERLPGFSSGSDAMVSKVCPVCRTFSSSSNTTLNAHIDQCLSAESFAGRGMAGPSKHKVKPRKKRTMEEICATAPRCTLEDLDRRNGTNWASELTSAAQIYAASRAAESKRPRISPPNSGRDEREGSVYVDSRGTKLLILSKLNDGLPPPPPLCAGRSKLKGFSKELRAGRGAPPGRPKSFPPKCGKYMKVKVQRKKTSYFKRSKALIHRAAEGEVDAGVRRGDERNAQEQAEMVKPGNLGLVKDFNGKINRGKRRSTLQPTDSRSTGDDQSISHASCEISGRVGDSPGPSAGPLLPPKTRSIGVLSKIVGLTDTPQSSPSSPRPPPEKVYGSTGGAFSPASSGSEVKLPLSKAADGLERDTDSSETDCGESPSSGQKPAGFGNLGRSSENHHGDVPKSGRDSRGSLLMDEERQSPTAEEEILQRVVSKKLRKGKPAENPDEQAEELSVEACRAEDDLRAAVDLQDKVSHRSSEGVEFLISDDTQLAEVAADSTLQIGSSSVKGVGSSSNSGEAVASEDLGARSLDDPGASSTGAARATVDEEKVVPKLLGDQGVDQCSRRLDIVKRSTVASDGESPGSPVSSSSTISHLSVEERESPEGHLTELENFKSDFRESALLMGGGGDDDDDDGGGGGGVRGPGRANLEKKAPRLKAIPPAQEHEKLWEGQACRYSRPSLSQRRAWGACPVLGQEAMAAPVSDFSTGPASAMARTASSPVLRLMGKNLMVTNREEKPLHQHGMASPSSSGEASLLGFPPPACSFPNQGEDFWFHHHRRMEGSIFPRRHPSWLPAETTGGGFGGPMLHGGIRARTGLLPRALIPERQVIVIDDSPPEPGGGRGSTAGAIAGHYYGSDFRRVAPPLPPPPPCFQPQRWLQWRGPGHNLAMANISPRWGGSLEAYSGPPQRASVFPSLPADLLAPAFRHLPSVYWTPR